MERYSTGNGASLTSRQEAVLPIIAAATTLSEAARQAHVGRTTLYRWLQDPYFRQMVQRLRAEAYELAKSELQALSLKSIRVLNEALDDPKSDIRLRAARATLYLSVKVNDLREMEQRLELLDEALVLRNSRSPGL